MRVILIHNVKNTVLRVGALLIVVVLLYFCLPPFYDKVSSSENNDDFTEMNEPLRVENEINPDNLSAWFNSLYE